MVLNFFFEAMLTTGHTFKIFFNLVLEGKDVRGAARMGSGKTLTFLSQDWKLFVICNKL